MGQYFIAINEDKKEFICPQRFGDGLKFMEFACSSGGFLTGLALLLRRSSEGGGGDWYGYSAPDDAPKLFPVVGSWVGDAVSIVGDYDKSALYQTAENGWADISFPIMRAMCCDRAAKAGLMARCKWMMDYDGRNARAEEYKELFKQATFYEGEHGRAMEGKCPLPEGLI